MEMQKYIMTILKKKNSLKIKLGQIKKKIKYLLNLST